MSLSEPRTRSTGHRSASRAAHHAWLAARAASGVGRGARPIAGSNLNRHLLSGVRRTAHRMKSVTASDDRPSSQGYWLTAHAVAAAKSGKWSGTEAVYA